MPARALSWLGVTLVRGEAESVRKRAQAGARAEILSGRIVERDRPRPPPKAGHLTAFLGIGLSLRSDRCHDRRALKMLFDPPRGLLEFDVQKTLDQFDAVASTTFRANPSPPAALVIEAEAIPAAAHRAWTMPVAQRRRRNA